MISHETPTSDPPVISPEARAFFTKTLWIALLKPDGTRSDLIDLGMEVLAKTPLSKIPDKKFERLLPYLSQASEYFALQVRTKFMDEVESYIRAQETSFQNRINDLEKQLVEERNQIDSLRAQLATPKTEIPVAENPTPDSQVAESSESPNE